MTGEYCGVEHLFRQQDIRVGTCRSDCFKKIHSPRRMCSVPGLALSTLRISGGFQGQSLLHNGLFAVDIEPEGPESNVAALRVCFKMHKPHLHSLKTQTY